MNDPRNSTREDAIQTLADKMGRDRVELADVLNQMELPPPEVLGALVEARDAAGIGRLILDAVEAEIKNRAAERHADAEFETKLRIAEEDQA